MKYNNNIMASWSYYKQYEQHSRLSRHSCYRYILSKPLITDKDYNNNMVKMLSVQCSRSFAHSKR